MVRLPAIRLGNVSVSRLVAGSNAVSGFSHASAERSQQMLDYFTAESTKRFFASCEANGITAIVARTDPFILRMLREHWREGGSIRWIAQTAPEHRDPFKNITQAQRGGASAVYVHGGVVDRLFEAGGHEEVRKMIMHARGLGLPGGIAAHDPKNLLAAQERGFPVDFFMVCMHNVTGYQGNQGVEQQERFDDEDRASALSVLRRLDGPCLAYKVLAAGRKTPRQGLSDVAPALRPHDGVVMGMFPPDAEDVVRDNVSTFCDVMG
jgi:hypothetical protein